MKKEDHEKAIKALELIDLHNPLRDDLDFYLMFVAEWGLGFGPKPNPLDHGVKEQKTTVREI